MSADSTEEVKIYGAHLRACSWNLIDTCYTLPGVLYRNDNSIQYVSYTSTPLALLVPLGLPKNSIPIV